MSILSRQPLSSNTQLPAKAMEDMPVPSQGLSTDDVNLAENIADKFGGGYDVGHSAPFWIVDKHGIIQVGMEADSTLSDIVKNIRVLLKG